MSDDLISRQAAIEAMKSISDSICEQQAIDALCDLPSAQPEPRWIPVTERLPSDFEHVYVSVRSEGREDWVIDVWYDPHLTCPWGDVAILISGKAVVCAWMPVYLPEPWKGETDAED